MNNLRGHITKDNKIIYKEDLGNGLYFVVYTMYENLYDKPHWKNSTSIGVECCITSMGTYIYSNGVIVLEGSLVFEEYPVTEKVPPLVLEETKTKDGFKVFQVLVSDTTEMVRWWGDGNKINRRTKQWLVVVPKNDLIKIISNGL